MHFQVTQIEFDFDDAMADESITDEYKQEVIDEILGCAWYAVDEDGLGSTTFKGDTTTFELYV